MYLTINCMIFAALYVMPVCSVDTALVKNKVSMEQKLEKAKRLQLTSNGSKKDIEQNGEESPTGGNKEYTGRYVMRYDGDEEEAEQFAETLGFSLDKQTIKYLKGYFIFTDQLSRSDKQYAETVKKMKMDKKFKSFYKEQKTYPTKLTTQPNPIPDLNITDAFWSKQWDLHPTTRPSLGIYEAWELGYSGKGVVMAIVDDGIDTNHSDLITNYNASLSFNFVYNADGGIHIYTTDGHGTKCAGLAGASKNDQCIIGAAYEVTLASLRILDYYSTEAVTGGALTHMLDSIDIYSNSWGYTGHGADFLPLYPLEEAGIIQGIKEGRDGKGAIYLFAAGNDGNLYDDCNMAGTVNSIYTIGIAALADDGSAADYSEQCTCLMAATYGGQGESLMATTARDDTCTDDFLGTSASCPIAAGIVAMTLQANPDLTWRDMQHVIAETSSHVGVPSEVQTNGAGKNVSFTHGFGVMNADAMVKSALTWKTVPNTISCFGETQTSDKCCTETFNATYELNKCHINYLEHVHVHVSYRALWREYMEIHVISPAGTDSRLTRQRRLDSSYGPAEWTFMTVFHWGENPTGTWMIRMDDFLNCDNAVYLYTWTLTLHGTVTDPLDGTPSAGLLGGVCDVNTPCTDGTECLYHYNICVYCNLTDYRVNEGFCAEDGRTGGYCNVSVPCVGDQAWCNINNTCGQCEQGYRRYDDDCFEDGMLGGYCDFNLECMEVDVGCDWMTSRCINCSNGFHVIYGYCTQDGTYLGYCDSNITCDDPSSIACSPADNICISCSYNKHIFGGFCYEDGALGGYCSTSVPCTETGTGCDFQTGRCTQCLEAGFHILDRVCRADGLLLGFCNESVTCQDGSSCSPDHNACIVCSSPGYRRVQDGFCRQDGMLAGYCDNGIRCTPDRAACSRDTNICIICYSGHHVKDGFCVKGKSSGDTSVTRKLTLDSGATSGSLIGGILLGMVVTAPAFIFIFKKLLLTQVKPSTVNGGDHLSYQNGNTKFSN